MKEACRGLPVKFKIMRTMLDFTLAETQPSISNGEDPNVS